MSGLSAERLARIGTWVQGEIDAKRVPGAVVMVARSGKLAYDEALGQHDPASPRPMKADDTLPHLLDDQAASSAWPR